MISALQKAPLFASLFQRKEKPVESRKSSATVRQPEVETEQKQETPEALAAQAAQRVLQQFFEVAPERVAEIRTLFAKVSFTPAGPARNAILAQLTEHARVLRSLCDSPVLEGLSKLTRGLEGLFRQLCEKPDSVTPSTLRTAAGAIVLLQTICQPGLTGDFCSEPAPRFLVIDDNPVCRRTIASSLQQLFSPPELAHDGPTAVARIQAQPYDIIFLDVDMPGMDGFEVCSKTRESRPNATTPVVFVTSHSDFDSRAKSSEVGGNDLIAKPFLPFELTLKALTVLLRRRMLAAPPIAAPAK